MSKVFEQPVKNNADYFKKLVWFLDRSSIFLKDKKKNRIVILKGLNPADFNVYVQDTDTGEAYYTHIDNVEPIIK